MKLTVIKVEDIPRMIFGTFDGESKNVHCQNGSYYKKNFIIKGKEVKVLLGKSSNCNILIVFFAPFKETVKYNILIRVGDIGDIKEQSICEKLDVNNTKHEFIAEGRGLFLYVREKGPKEKGLVEESITSMIIEMVTTMTRWF